ncbi:hypothetical protein ABKV19_022303 [Rosa sericea]
MGNIISNCFTHKEASDRWREEKEENKHHEQRDKVSVDRISGLPDRCIYEEEEIKHHEKRNSTDLADRISDLPDDILLLILSFLPFKSVGQSSVLSRRWSHVWSSYPIFDFYDIFTGNEALHHQTRARIINTVLARHDENYNIMCSCLKFPFPSGSLGQFRRVGEDPNDSCFAKVEELVLDISLSSENTSVLPRCQLKCQSLRSSSCGNSKAWLGFPSSYVVWSYLLSLQSLSLIRMDLLDSSHNTGASGVDLFSGSSFPCLEKLNIESCRGMSDLKISGTSFPCLEELNIESCRGMSDLKISCRNLKDIRVFNMGLKSMDISGMRLEHLRVSYCFANCISGSWVNIFAPNLKFFIWLGNDITEKCSIQSFPALRRSNFLCPQITTTKISNDSVVDLFSSSSQVEELIIDSDFLQILSKIYFELGGLPFSFMKLKSLEIKIEKRYIPSRGIACLFKNSPMVHNLRIYLVTHSYEGNDKWNDSDDANCTCRFWETRAQYLSPFLSNLKVVEISLGNMIPENGITFAKFFLKYGRGLQKVILRFWRGKSTLPPNLLNDTIALMEGIPRASADVEFSTSCY